MFIMIFSLFSFSQRCLWGNFNIKEISEVADSGEHIHEHNVLSRISFLMTGFLVHTHEHNHDDQDTHNSRESKTHSHAEVSQIKTDFIAYQNMFSFSDSLESCFGTLTLNLHIYDHPFQIFRPPINV